MATTSKKKKLVSTIAAVATSAALLLGGTLAWQSANQTALNEASDVINPGGRLHDDFYIDANGDYNADIYVENFDKEDIFARVQLQEYMEVIMNYGTKGEKPYDVLGEMDTAMDGSSINRRVRKDADGNIIEELYEREYTTRSNYEPITENYTVDAGIDKRDNANPVDYWTWTMGSADSETVYFMPTFNKNKDSLVADRNGMYVDRIGGISNWGADQYEDYTIWQDGDTKTADAIYDSDYDDIDDVKYDFENLTQYIDAGNITTVEEEHIAKAVGTTNGFITMTEWLEKLNNGEATENYWVWDDTDENNGGWIYWSSPIPAGETTGLLLDSIELKDVMDDTWYYAINVIAQFVTADDAGKADGTGFYDTEKGSVPSANAEALLKEIGVKLSEGEEEDEPQTLYLELNWNEDASVNANPGDKIILSINPDDEAEHTPGDLSAITVRNNDNDEYLTEGEHYTYDPDTQTFVMLDSGTGYSLRAHSGGISSVHINENSENAYGGNVVFSEAEDEEGPIEYRIWCEETDEGINYHEGEIAYIGDGNYQLFVMEEDGRYYAGEYPNDFEWEVDTDLAYTVDDVAKREELDEHYVSVLFTLDETVEWESEHTFTATNPNDGFTMTATVCYGEDPYSGGDEEEEGIITVDGIGPDKDGYIYLQNLDVDAAKSFPVVVNSSIELAEDGLTYETEHYVIGTDVVVDENDPYTATLNIAARDYQSIIIRATDVEGNVYEVTVVPMYDSIVITPAMNGTTIYVSPDYYTLIPEDFTNNDSVSFTLDGASRSEVFESEGKQMLSVISSESGTDIKLTATDGTDTAVITIKVTRNNPMDGPVYSYYIEGSGENRAHPLVETQEYYWVQEDTYSYRVHANMIHSYTGPADWKLSGLTEEGSVYFTDKDGTTQSDTYTGLQPYIKFTAAQTDPFTVMIDYWMDDSRTDHFTFEGSVEDEYGDYVPGTIVADSTTQYFTIYPIQNGYPSVRNLSVYSSEDADYETPVYLVPGGTTEVYFEAIDYNYNDPGLNNASVTWELVEENDSCTFTIEENGDDTNTATVTHTCAEGSCSTLGEIRVKVSYDGAYGAIQRTSSFYILPEGYTGDLEFGEGDWGDEDYEPHFYFDGNYELPLAVPAGKTMTVELDSLTTYDTYAITARNNADLTADENGYYTTPLDEKEGLTVIAMPGEYEGEPFTQYFYGEEIPLTGDAGEGSYTFNFSDPDTADSVENVTIVAVDEDGSIITQVSTKVYDPDTHTYAGSNSANQGSSGWLLVFDALDENGSSVGYCVANAAQTQLSVDPMYPASAYVTEGTFEDDFNVSDAFDINAATACTGTHGSSIVDAVLYSDDAELTQVSRGQSYTPSVKVGDEAKAVTSWRVKGAQSTATRFEGDTLYIGHFEPADSLTILVTLEDEQYFNEFTVTVTGDSGLTDISDQYALAHPNGSEENAEMVYLSDELWPGMISDDNYVVERAGFEPLTTTLANATYLTNLSSIELVGNKLAAVTITGSWELEDEDSVQFGIVDSKIVSFRTDDITDEGEPLTLYVITADGRYIAHSFSIVDFEGE